MKLKIISGVIAIFIMFSLAGCGGNGDDDIVNENGKKENGKPQVVGYWEADSETDYNGPIN